jgi:nickel superoxide dismutase
MVEKYNEIGEVDDENPESMNTAIRCIMTKEEHAQKCKDQLYLLWSDYFKPEHLEKFPDLHDKFWKATKQCGKVKQTMSLEECEKLIEMVHDISHMFADSKK